MKAKQIIFLAAIIIMFVGVSCKCHKTRPGIAETTNKTTNFDAFRLIISFISIGTGPDTKAIEAVDNYITEYNKANNLTLVVEEYPWGREGEKDYCLPLTEISSEKQIVFVQDIKALVKSSTRVFVMENEVCKHKK